MSSKLHSKTTSSPRLPTYFSQAPSSARYEGTIKISSSDAKGWPLFYHFNTFRVRKTCGDSKSPQRFIAPWLAAIGKNNVRAMRAGASDGWLSNRCC